MCVSSTAFMRDRQKTERICPGLAWNRTLSSGTPEAVVLLAGVDVSSPVGWVR